MAAPGMIIPPLIMSKLEKTAAFIKNPWLKAPVTVSQCCGTCAELYTGLFVAYKPREIVSLQCLSYDSMRFVIVMLFLFPVWPSSVTD